MPADLDRAAKEIFDALVNGWLPQDYLVWAEPENGIVAIGTAEIAVTIRRGVVADGLHIETAKTVMPHLIAAVEAAKRVRGVVITVADNPVHSAHIHLVPPAVDLSQIGRPTTDVI